VSPLLTDPTRVLNGNRVATLGLARTSAIGPRPEVESKSLVKPPKAAKGRHAARASAERKALGLGCRRRLPAQRRGSRRGLFRKLPKSARPRDGTIKVTCKHDKTRQKPTRTGLVRWKWSRNHWSLRKFMIQGKSEYCSREAATDGSHGWRLCATRGNDPFGVFGDRPEGSVAERNYLRRKPRAPQSLRPGLPSVATPWLLRTR